MPGHQRGKMKNEKSDRTTAIVARYNAGRTYREIADEFRISRQRVGQIIGPIKTRARDLMECAIADGKIKPASTCSKCGSDNRVIYHQPDLLAPLMVIWLCSKCYIDARKPQQNGESNPAVLLGRRGGRARRK